MCDLNQCIKCHVISSPCFLRESPSVEAGFRRTGKTTSVFAPGSHLGHGDFVRATYLLNTSAISWWLYDKVKIFSISSSLWSHVILEWEGGSQNSSRLCSNERDMKPGGSTNWEEISKTWVSVSRNVFLIPQKVLFPCSLGTSEENFTIPIGCRKV